MSDKILDVIRQTVPCQTDRMVEVFKAAVNQERTERGMRADVDDAVEGAYFALVRNLQQAGALK